jgi:hypothetical protein
MPCADMATIAIREMSGRRIFIREIVATASAA